MESTSYPSTTREKIEKKLSNKYLGVGKDYLFGYSPERISPGQKEKLEQIPKLYCSVSRNCTALIKELYRKIFKKIIRTNTIEVFKTSKIF